MRILRFPSWNLWASALLPFMKYDILGISSTLTELVVVYLCLCILTCIWPKLYLCICICVFASQTTGNIVFEVLLPLPFQKYSTCDVYLQLWPQLYLRICVFVFVYLQVRHPGTLFLRSLNHHLSENIWFVWSKTSYSGGERRCYQAGRTNEWRTTNNNGR